MSVSINLGSEQINLFSEFFMLLPFKVNQTTVFPDRVRALFKLYNMFERL